MASIPPCFNRSSAAAAVGDMLDHEPSAMENLLDEAGETGIVVDVKDADVPFCHQIGSGTCITEKNRPSCRIALAKPS